MTSTVLDVTVLLLCVSASVVALVGAGGDVSTNGPTAEDVADRLTTETVAMTYEAPDAPGGTRTVHATRAELLRMVVVANGRNLDADAGKYEAFRSNVQSAVADGLGPRTRLDVRPLTTATPGSDENATGAPVVAPFGEKTANGAAWWSANETGTPSWPTAATGTSWGVELRDEMTAGAVRERGEAEPADARSEVDETGAERARTARIEVAIGASPPRTADTTTAVLRHPTQGDTASVEGVRIVVRRW